MDLSANVFKGNGKMKVVLYEGDSFNGVLVFRFVIKRVKKVDDYAVGKVFENGTGLSP